MVEKVLSQELTGKKDLAFAEKFSIATANFFLNISNLYEATKEFAETMGISVEHADLWLKYIMSELETGLAGEKGGWSITYTLEKNDRTILEQELRNRFSADMLWQLFKNVDQEHHLAALQVGVKREDPEKKPEVIFAPDIRNWPLVVRVMRDNSKTLEKEINQVKALATDSKFAGKPKEEVQQIIDLKIAELKTRFQDPVTYVDVIIEKDAYQRTIAKRDPNHFMNQTVEPNPFSLIDWQGFIEGDDLPTDLEGITISEERMLTDWYIEKDLPTLTSQEQEFLSQNLKPGLTTEEIGQEVQTFSNPDFNPNHQIAFKRPDIVIGLETPTFKPAQAFYDPRVTLVLGINKETNAFTFKIPTHVPFDGLDLTNAWKETINSGIYQHFLVQESKNRAEEKNRQSGLMDTQVLPMPTWLAKRNIELGNDGGLTMAIETAMEAKPFENNGTYNFAELVGVRRAMAAIKLPDYIFTQMREFRKQSSLIEKFGDIKTSMLLMIAASLVDGRIAGTPVDPEDARLGIASMGAEIIKQLDGARSILVNNREDLEKHLVFYKSFSQWAELIKRTNNSKEAIELLNKYLEKTKPYNYAGCLESIKIIVESQDKSPSITDRKAINVFNKLILLLENNPLADEIIFRIAEFCNPPDLNSNTRPLVAVETLVEKINISDEEKRLLINEITELGSLARAQAYRLDNTNKFFFMTKAIVNGHIVTANSFEFTQGVTETNKLLTKIIEQYQTIGLVIEKIKSLLDNTSETDKYLVIGQEITTAIDTEKLEPFLNEVVLEISKIAKRAKKKVNPDEIVEKIIAIFNKKKKTLNLNQTPISPELIAALIKKINETNPGLIKNEATIIEKIYRQFELSEYDLVGLITKVDLALATLYEVTTTEFDTEDKKSVAINQAKEALLAINTTNNRYLNELKINLDHIPISTNEQIRRFVFDQRKKLFTIISHSHLISGIKYQIDSQKSQLIKEDKVGLHRFSSAVLESGAAVSNIIGKMSKDLSLAPTTIGAQLAGVKFLEKASNFTAPELMANLRVRSNVSTLGALDFDEIMDIAAIFYTANSGKGTSVGWGYYGDILTISESADDPTELVEVVLPFIRANKDLAKAFSEFIFPGIGSETGKQVRQMIVGKDYLCSTEDLDETTDNLENAKEVKKLKNKNRVNSDKLRADNVEASTNMIRRMKMVEANDELLNKFAKFCQAIIDQKIPNIKPELKLIVENFIQQGFQELWKAHLEMKLMSFSSEILNLIFILNSGLNPEGTFSELRNLMVEEQNKQQTLFLVNQERYTRLAKLANPNNLSEIEEQLPPEAQNKLAKTQLLAKTRQEL